MMELAIASVDERRAAMERRHPTWVPMTLDRYLTHALEDFADRPLIVTDDGEMSYAEIDAQATRIAQMLRNRGVQPGERVALLMANYPITVVLLFGIWRAEATAVPLNTLYRPDELGFVLNQAAPRLLIAMNRFLKRDFAAEIPAILPEGIDLMYYDPASPSTCDLTAAIDSVTTIAPPDLADAVRIPAVIMYTSGTTGSPKGVMQSHDNLLRAAYAGTYHQAFEEGRRAIFSLPLYHGFGLVVGLLSGMIVGGSIVPLLRFDSRAMLEGIGRHRATYLMGVPTMTVSMLELAEQETFDLGSLTAIHSAAAPTPSWVWKRIQTVFDCGEIFTSYGQTEATATIICTQPGDPIEVVARRRASSSKAASPAFANAAATSRNSVSSIPLPAWTAPLACRARSGLADR